MKVLKFLGIGIGVILVILIVAAIALPYFLPLDKIKDMAAEKASEAIHRDVKIGKVAFNVFKGIEVRDVTVSNRPGYSNEPFISAGLIELKYNLWALLGRKVAIDKIVLVKPEILIEQRDGISNYSDLIGAKKPAKTGETAKKETAKKSKQLPVSIMVSKFSIKDAKLTMVTYTKGVKKVMGLKDLNVNVSGISLKTTRPIDLDISLKGIYEGKEVPINVSGKIKFDLSRSYVNILNLDVSAAGEKLTLTAEITNFDKAPDIKMTLLSRKLDTDKFLAIVSGTGSKKPKVKAPPAPYGQQTANINRSLRSIPANIKINAIIDLNNILFKEMKLDSVASKILLENKIMNINVEEVRAYNGKISGGITADLNVSGIKYSVKDMVLKGFNAKPFANDVIDSFLTALKDNEELKDKIEGTLDVNVALTGSGVETPDIIANAKANGSFLLKDGKVRKLKSLEGIADKLGVETLKHDLDLKEFKAGFTVANKVASIKDLILHNGEEGDAKITFNGKANIGTKEFISGNVLALKLNPRLTKGMSKEWEPFIDKEGWLTVEFELTGSLTKPIPIPKLDKPMQKMIEKEQEKAKEQVESEVEKKKQEAEEQLQREMEEKAKELLKF